MKKPDLLGANALIIATITGAGIFALPYVLNRAGVIPAFFIYFVVLLIVIIIHLLLADIVKESQERHRIPGYIRKILGRNWGNVSLITTGFGMVGGLLAYLILGAGFLRVLTFGALGGMDLAYVVVFFLLNFFLISLGFKTIKGAEIYLGTLLIITLGILSFLALRHFSEVNFSLINLKYAALPYGVIIFSFWGTSIIPDAVETLKKDRQLISLSLLGSFLLVAFLYLSFSVAVIGATGSDINENALTALAGVLSKPGIMIGALFGFLAVFTSYLAFGTVFDEILKFDVKIKNRLVLGAAGFAPLVLYLLGVKDFLSVVSITGAVFLGIEGILIVLAHKKMIKKYPSFIYATLIALLSFGVLGELYYFFVR